jgi:NitT/TauT family transport system permease protein
VKYKILVPLVTIVLLVVVCEVGLNLAHISKFLFPKPSLIFQSMITDGPWIIHHLKITLMEAGLGFLLGMVLGITLALSYLFIPALENVVVPFAVAVINVPFVAIAPILFITFGYGPLPKVIIVMVVSFFPIMSNFSAGLNSVNPNLQKRFFVLKATKWNYFTKLQLPSSIPFLVAGLQIAVSNVIIAAIVGELLGTTQGLGFVILMSVSQYRFALLMATVVITTLTSMVLTSLVRLFTKTIFRKYLTV